MKLSNETLITFLKIFSGELPLPEGLTVDYERLFKTLAPSVIESLKEAESLRGMPRLVNTITHPFDPQPSIPVYPYPTFPSPTTIYPIITCENKTQNADSSMPCVAKVTDIVPEDAGKVRIPTLQIKPLGTHSRFDT